MFLSLQEIDADQSMDEVHTELKSVVDDILNRPRAANVGQLWTSDTSGEANCAYPVSSS